MPHSKFFTLLGALNEGEFYRFQRHVNQSHHKDSAALKVFNYFKRYHGNIKDAEALTLEDASAKVFKKATNSTRKLSDSLSDLHLCLKGFLISEKLRQNELVEQILWFQVLSEHNLKADFSREALSFYSTLNKKPVSRLPDHINVWFANYFYREQLTWNHKKPDLKTIQNCAQTMGACWEVLRLKMACESALLLKSQAKGLLKPSDAAQNESKSSSLPLQMIYQELLQFSISESDFHYSKIETILDHIGGKIDRKELHEILMHLKNFVAPQARNDHEADAAQKLHRLNLIGLKHGIFSENGVLSYLEFQNIISTACAAGSIKWADEFVHTHGQFLPVKARSEGPIMGRAIISFSNGKFQEVINAFENSTFPNFQSSLRAKCLLLRCYYELSTYSDSINPLCDDIGAQIRKKPHSDPFNAVYEFIQIVRLLSSKKVTQAYLFERISKDKQIYFRGWLREKAEQYEQKPAGRKRNR